METALYRTSPGPYGATLPKGEGMILYFTKKTAPVTGSGFM